MNKKEKDIILRTQNIPTERIINQLIVAIQQYLDEKHDKSSNYKNILQDCSLLLIQHSAFTAGVDVTAFLSSSGLVKLPYDES